VSLCFNSSFAQNIRQDILLNNNWHTIATANDKLLPTNSYSTVIDNNWKQVDVPYNWDAYEGYRRLLHGNRHGDSWYRKNFSLQQAKTGKRFFLFFEGVGSYASVFLNDVKVGEHAGGRTTFTIDVTDVIKVNGVNNLLAVRAYHPSNIKDLPWVCGGGSDERGFSEGSQPMGIFRPVHLIVTNDVRIEPFGVHAWANKDLNEKEAKLSINTTIKNYSGNNRNVTVINQLVDANNKLVKEVSFRQLLKADDSLTMLQKNIVINKPLLWSVQNPYLYKVISLVKENNKLIDRTETSFGFRTIEWKTPTNQFFLNGKPVFINGVAEYEHLLGQSHAFSKEQVLSRMKWVKAAGFNSFRDAHQPHNLLYGQLCNKMGILWWTQLSAHIWFDTPEFKNNFKKLLREWVIERRNDPSVILWGLQNESKLPDDFAKECTELIRKLDPTTSSQRLVTTCNGGTGTDWDVPQNWTGTYGGDPNTYASDVKKQVLIGEYGAWRTLDLHTEGPYVQNGILSEDRMTQLMEQKIRLAESAKDSSAGQFFWLLNSHDNPGRVQGGEGWRELDRVGPVNYKGLLTPWEEPLDVFYMFRSNYASKEKEPMVYIVSHTWPGRWTTTGKKDSIIIYSNCDEVELFNDVDHISLGRKKRKGVGEHFQWDNADINYNVLYAIGYIKGKAVAKDHIVLDHLPPSPHFNEFFKGAKPILEPQPGYHYIYRVNCGGPDYKDENRNIWSADRSIGDRQSVKKSKQLTVGNKHLANSKKATAIQLQTTNYEPQTFYGSLSWTNDFPGMPSFFASQRRTLDVIYGTRDWKLFQDFRYGKDKLQYEFPLASGEYLIELYFIEPWLGTGGGMDCTGMRLFDVAFNGKTVIKDLDIWKEAGHDRALKKIVKTTVSGGKLIISFPRSASGQAVISAIAIASLKQNIKAASSPSLVSDVSSKNCNLLSWLDAGDKQYSDASIRFRSLPPNLYGADWLQFLKATIVNTVSFNVNEDADVFVGIDKATSNLPSWLKKYENTQAEIETDENGSKKYIVYRKRFLKGAAVQLNDGNNPVMIMPVTNMQPAYDLKPISSYRASVAKIGKGLSKEQANGREAVVVKTKEQTITEWAIQTGVADIYSITIKYYCPLEKMVKGRVQLIGQGNTMMMEEPLNFTFTRPGKWNTTTVNTGTMINAGNYAVQLMIDDGEGLALSGIDVQ
jgi:hypothetical protein